jgi:hypothetical protein
MNAMRCATKIGYPDEPAVCALQTRTSLVAVAPAELAGARHSR